MSSLMYGTESRTEQQTRKILHYYRIIQIYTKRGSPSTATMSQITRLQSFLSAARYSRTLTGFELNQCLLQWSPRQEISHPGYCKGQRGGNAEENNPKVNQRAQELCFIFQENFLEWSI